MFTSNVQEVTRAQRSKGWALDSVVLQNVVTRFWKEEITESPAEGKFGISFHSLNYRLVYNSELYFLRCIRAWLARGGCQRGETNWKAGGKQTKGFVRACSRDLHFCRKHHSWKRSKTL